VFCALHPANCLSICHTPETAALTAYTRWHLLSVTIHCHGKNSSSAFILDLFLIAACFNVQLFVNYSSKTSIPDLYVRKHPAAGAVRIPANPAIPQQFFLHFPLVTAFAHCYSLSICLFITVLHRTILNTFFLTHRQSSLLRNCQWREAGKQHVTC